MLPMFSSLILERDTVVLPMFSSLVLERDTVVLPMFLSLVLETLGYFRCSRH